MVRRKLEIAELIRQILDGVSTSSAKRRLAGMGGAAVEPILEAVTGRHGRLHSDRVEAGIKDLVSVLEKIANKHPGSLASALAHHVPGLNLAVWALGHSSSSLARGILRDLTDHEDNGVRAVAEYHLARGSKSSSRRRLAHKKA